MTTPSIIEVYNKYLVVKAKADTLAKLYQDYYGQLSPDLSNRIYVLLTGMVPKMDEIYQYFKENGITDEGLGIVWWIPVLAAVAIVGGIGLGVGALYEYDRYLDFKNKELDSANSAGITEAYFIEQQKKAPSGLADVKSAAAGFGLGTIAALAFLGWALFSGRKRG